VSDSAGAQTVLGAIRKRWPWLKHLFEPLRVCRRPPFLRGYDDDRPKTAAIFA
jgi:hypothetical protein